MVVYWDFIETVAMSKNSSALGPFYSVLNSGNRFPSGSGGGNTIINSGMIGKVIFWMQDSQSNEIAWMGISSGVIYGGSREFALDKMDPVLHQLLTSLYGID